MARTAVNCVITDNEHKSANITEQQHSLFIGHTRTQDTSTWKAIMLFKQVFSC